MTRLLRVELRRLFARRLVRSLAALLLATLATTLVVNGIKSNRDVAGARAKAERQVSTFGGQQPEGALQACEADAKAQNIPAAQAHCRPTAADFYREPRLFYASKASTYLNAGVGLGLAFAVVVAVAGIGAEWAAGTFASLLLWEPRRRRVLAAKLGAVMVIGAAVTAVSALAYLAGAWLIAATRGSLAGSVGRATNHALQNGGRGVVAAALLSLIMGSIAVLLRSTAGALGIVAIYTVGAENVLRALKPQWARWELGPNVVALITGRVRLPTSSPTISPDESFSGPPLWTLSAGRAFSYLLILAAVAVTAAAVFLQRRDVT